MNPVLSTGSGDITIRGAGLTGSMTTLQLVAARLKIDGAVSNKHVNPGAGIALSGGRAEVTLDSSVSPLTTLRPLAKRRDLNGPVSELVVDVTPRGNLSASRVGLVVSGRGAGVSYAGRGQAALGDFAITASGKVTTKGARVQAERGLKIDAAAADVLSRGRRQSVLTSVTRSVTVVAGAGDIHLRGQITGAERDREHREARGGVTLKASRDITLHSRSADELAIAFASKDDLYVRAGRDIRNDTGRLLSNANLVVRAGSTVRNSIEVPEPNTQLATARRPRGGLLARLFGWRRRAWVATVDLGETRIPDQLALMAGQSVDMRAGAVENSGEIDALDGALLLQVGRLTNRGVPAGRFQFAKTCGWACSSRGWSEAAVLGGTINAAGSAAIDASQSIENSGQVVAYGNLSVTAPAISARAVHVPEFARRPAGLFNGFSGPTALLTLQPIGGSFLAPAGTVTVNSRDPVLLDGGRIQGQIAAEIPGGTVEVKSAQPFFAGGLRHVGLFRYWVERLP